MKLVSLGFRPYLKSDLKTGSNAPLFFSLFFSSFLFLHWGRFSNGMHRAQCITGGISTTNVAFVSRANNPPCRLPLPAPRDSSAPFTICTSSGCPYLFPFPMKGLFLVRENVEIRWIDWKWKKETKQGKGFVSFKKKTFLKGFFFFSDSIQRPFESSNKRVEIYKNELW